MARNNLFRSSQKGQSTIEACVGGGVFTSAVIFIFSISVLALANLNLRRLSYEALLCGEWNSLNQCELELSRKARKAWKMPFFSGKISQSRRAREIEVHYQILFFPKQKFIESILLPIEPLS